MVNDVLLRKQVWFLGELNKESATEILKTCQEFDVFIVHLTPAQDYTLSVKFSIEGKDEGIIAHFIIKGTHKGKYKIIGDDHSYDSIVEVVNSYTASREPPLLPALGEHEQLDKKPGISAPPSYTEANQYLQPDIASLPNINNITPENITEAETGLLSSTGPAGSGNPSNRPGTPPDYMNNPHWWRYRDKSCCHPRNICHFCCHGKSRWNGLWEVAYGKWYDCRGTGFCRCLLLILMWFFIWPCAVIYLLSAAVYYMTHYSC